MESPIKAEKDEVRIALSVVEPVLQARIDRICRQVLAEWKVGRLTQEEGQKLKAEYDAARALMGILNQEVK